MYHRIVGNISGMVNDLNQTSDNNAVIIQYHYYEGPDEQMCIVDISVYGAYPGLLRAMDQESLTKQVQSNITNIEGDEVEFKIQTLTIL